MHEHNQINFFDNFRSIRIKIRVLEQSGVLVRVGSSELPACSSAGFPSRSKDMLTSLANDRKLAVGVSVSRCLRSFALCELGGLSPPP